MRLVLIDNRIDFKDAELQKFTRLHVFEDRARTVTYDVVDAEDVDYRAAVSELLTQET